jgi:pyruvate formate lyase activating enzyme
LPPRSEVCELCGACVEACPTQDDEAGLEAAAHFAAAVPGVQQVNLLPFHRTGLPKSRRLGQPSGLAEVQPPSPEAMKRALEIFAGAGLAVRTGG